MHAIDEAAGGDYLFSVTDFVDLNVSHSSWNY